MKKNLLFLSMLFFGVGLFADSFEEEASRFQDAMKKAQTVYEFVTVEGAFKAYFDSQLDDEDKKVMSEMTAEEREKEFAEAFHGIVNITCASIYEAFQRSSGKWLKENPDDHESFNDFWNGVCKDFNPNQQ